MHSIVACPFVGFLVVAHIEESRFCSTECAEARAACAAISVPLIPASQLPPAYVNLLHSSSLISGAPGRACGGQPPSLLAALSTGIRALSADHEVDNKTTEGVCQGESCGG